MAANKTFRIEQLKRAHMTRYGPIGQDLQQVRRSMHHTKRIVQSLEGNAAASYEDQGAHCICATSACKGISWLENGTIASRAIGSEHRRFY